MQTGTKISGIAHFGLIAAALFGGAFRSEPLPFELHEVSVVSSEEYAALTAPRQPPEIAEEITTPTEPEPSAPTDDLSEQEVEPVPEPVPEQTAPEPVPEPEEPEIVDAPEPTPPPSIDRVAPEPVVRPPEDARPDVVEQPEIVNDDTAEIPQEQQEEQEATAPEEAVDQIVTEAEEPRCLLRTNLCGRRHAGPRHSVQNLRQRPSPKSNRNPRVNRRPHLTEQMR